MIRCKSCNGINIEQKAWIDPNSNTALDSCSDGESEDNWCRDCNLNVDFIDDIIEE